MKLSPVLKRSLQSAVEQYHSHVGRAASYLEERGLWDPEIVERFQLGVVAGDVPSEHRSFAGRLCLPYITPTGIVQIKFRCIRNHECKKARCRKYLALPMPLRVYNVQALHDASSVIYIAEGEIDAISATVMGYPCVGISGANKWEPHYSRLFDDFAEVVAFAEGDDKGRQFGARVRDELEGVRIVYLPEGEDVNSLLASEDISADDFDTLIR